MDLLIFYVLEMKKKKKSYNKWKLIEWLLYTYFVRWVTCFVEKNFFIDFMKTF